MFTTPTTSVPPSGPVVRVTGASGDRPPPAASAAPKAADQAPAPAPGQTAAPAPEPPASQLKLVVAQAQSSLAYTYTLVDKVTGRVVAAIPFEAAEKAAASPNYTPGGVVDTHA